MNRPKRDMKILIAPMAAAAPTSGPISRARTIAVEAKKREHNVAFCAAEEMNYKAVEGVKNFYSPIPKLFGKIPLSVSKRILPIIQKLRIQERKNVKSFEQVLQISGAICGDFFAKDVGWIRKAINEFKPDVIFAEFRPAAIVAAKLENIKVVTDYSYPTQKDYASSPEYSKNVKLFLKENNLPEITSVLDIFNWADEKIVASSHSLEPFLDKNIHFVGPLLPTIKAEEPTGIKNIIFYMGSGTISSDKTIKTAIDAFCKSNYQVYIATNFKSIKHDFKNIHIKKRFDFSKLMSDCIAFINHGGQNSIMTGLVFGVPQIIFPGKVFERKYNAHSVEKIGAGFYFDEKDFNSNKIISTIKKIKTDLSFKKNASKAGKELLKLGGVTEILNIIENINNTSQQ